LGKDSDILKEYERDEVGAKKPGRLDENTAVSQAFAQGRSNKIRPKSSVAGEERNGGE